MNNLKEVFLVRIILRFFVVNFMIYDSYSLIEHESNTLKRTYFEHKLSI